MTNVNLKTFIESILDDYVTETEAYTLIGDPFEIRIPPPTITLTTNKNILSYSDNDTATCTVTAIGETNDYSIDWYIDDEYITNTEFSNNTCSYTYNSQGEGDITVRANLINSEDTVIDSETVIIEDCYYYDPMTSDTGRWDWNYNTNVSHSYSNDGVRIATGSISSDTWIPSDIVLPSNCEVEAHFTWEGSAKGCLAVHNTFVYSDSKLTCFDLDDSNAWNNRTESSNTISVSSATVKYVVNGNTLTFYANGNQLLSKTIIKNTPVLMLHTKNSNSWIHTVKDIKVKQINGG